MTLDRYGRRNGAPQASGGLNYLRNYEAALAHGAPPKTLVLVLRHDVSATARTFAQRYPDAAVHVLVAGAADAAAASGLPPNVHLHATASPEERVEVLSTLPRPQLLVEAAARSAQAKVAALRTLHGWVAADGLLAVEQIDLPPTPASTDARATVREVLEDARARKRRRLPPTGWGDWIDTLAHSSRKIMLRRDLALVRKRQALGQVLSAQETDRVLQLRFGEATPLTTIAVRPPTSYERRGEVQMHVERPAATAEEVPQRIEIPELALRSYRDAVVLPRQLVSYDSYWLPESFRRQPHPYLRHRALIRSSDDLVLLRPRWTPSQRHAWDGPPLYHLDSEFPGHFGHVCTEVIGRLWGWDQALSEFPDLRPVISIRGDQTDVPQYEKDILAAYGIDPSLIVVQDGDEALEVKRLIGVDAMWARPGLVAPELTSIWQRIRDELPPTPPPVRTERLFVSRSGRRSCLQASEIEAFFADRGFTVVLPERYSYAQQVALFAQARIIAGYAGSAMFTMMHAPQARIILIAGDGYTVRNEAMIAGVNGNELHYFWGTTHTAPPDRTRRRVVFAEDYSFDMQIHRRALQDALD